MPKKTAQTKNQPLPLEIFPGDWGTLEDIAELEREAESARQIHLAAEAKVTAAKAAARNAAMKNLDDLMIAAGITIYDLAAFKGISLEMPTAKESKPKKEKAPAKYRNPETGETHFGRGGNQLPKWLKDAKATGSLEEFRIK